MTESDSVLEGLVADARSVDPNVRWESVDKLGALPGVETEAVLVDLLGDEDFRVRERSVEALARRITPRVAAACAVALDDDANAGRRAASLALLLRAGEEGIRVLLGSLQHPSSDVRLSAAMSLPGRHPSSAALSAIEAAVRKETDPNVRAALLLALGRTGRREAIPTLLAVLEEGTLWLRVHALEALGEIGEPSVAPRLLPLLSHSALRRSTLRSLARLDSGAPAEELARRAAIGETDEALLAALRASAAAAHAETRQRIRGIWTAADMKLASIASDRDDMSRTDAAHLLALLDVPGAASAIVQHGPFDTGFDALADLPRARFSEALGAALQEETGEPALTLVLLARERGEGARLAPFLVHPSPVVRAATASALPPGSVSVADLLDLLAEEDPETALPAALALAVSDPSLSPEQRKMRQSVLLDRTRGGDGPGRAAALTALASSEGRAVDDAIRAGLASKDADVRRAAAGAAADREAMTEEEIAPLLSDDDPLVRAAGLRTIAAWAEKRPATLKTTWRDLLPGLADEPAVAAATGAAILALSGDERPRLVGEMLAQDVSVRRAALEELALTGDSEAAAEAAPATRHEDIETATAAVTAVGLAPAAIAEPALAEALRDSRAEVRRAAAEAVTRRGRPGADSPVPTALAAALAYETDDVALKAELEAAAVAGESLALTPLTAILATDRCRKEADEAAVTLTRRFPDEASRLWMEAPARAERRWAQAISRARGHGRAEGA